MKKNRNLLILIILLIVLFIGVGYSVLQSNLYIDSKITVDASSLHGNLLYDAAKSIGTEYTGATDGLGTYKIYTNSTDNSNDNVSFGGFCWKIIRTTETGGTKLLYNGEVSSTGTCENTGTDTQIGTSAFNNQYDSPSYLGYMYNTVYSIKEKKITNTDTNNYVLGNDVTYSGGKYVLTPTNASNITINGSEWSSKYNTTSYNHYTCFTSGTTCTSVYYVYYTWDINNYYYIDYIQLDNGKKVEDALDEMLGSNGIDVNVTNSTIKTVVDTWFASNLDIYSDYLEDTVFCNDRKIQSNGLGGWEPNGGDIYDYSYLYFYSYIHNSTSDFSCSNLNDRFTTSSSNGNGKLTYKVGLMTYSEALKMAKDSLYSGEDYWLLTSAIMASFASYNNSVTSSSTDYCGYDYSGYISGVRPVVSLANSIKYSSGDGSTTNPYFVKTT